MPLKATAYSLNLNDGFKNPTIKDQKMLNCLNVGIDKATGKVQNNNKYYKIELQEENGKYRIFTEYGRVGYDGTKEVRYPDNLYEAQAEFEAIIKKKKKGKTGEPGYVEVDMAQCSKGSDEAKQLIDISKVKIEAANINTKTSVKCDLEPEIVRLTQQFYDEAGKSLNTLIKGDTATSGSPLGKLSSNQIDKGRNVLQELADLINNSKNQLLTVPEALAISTDYYRSIPKSFGRNMKPEDVAITTIDAVNEQMEILKFYEDSLRIGDVIYDNSIIKQYDALHCNLKVLSKKDAKYKQLEEYFVKSQSQHHNFGMKVKNIFIAEQKKAPKFDPAPGNVQELFHGTRSCNMIGILSSNLKLPNQLKGVYITGAMFGPGIYFADQSSKSAQYAFGRFSGLKNMYDTNFLFITDVAIGKTKNEYSSKYYYEPPKGYDSVKGCKGSSLLHNEFIVYKENRCQIKYIIEFTSSYHSRW